MSVRDRRALDALAASPPTVIEAAATLAGLCSSTGWVTVPDAIAGDPARNLEEVPFVWRLLSPSERQLVRARAVARIHELGVPANLRGARDLEDEASYQLLAIAMRDGEERGPDPRDPYPRPLVGSVDELRNLLGHAERDQLVARYEALEHLHDREPTDMTAAEFGALVALAHKQGRQLAGTIEGLRFTHAQELFALYGRPAIDLSLWQLLVFDATLAAAQRKDGDKGKSGKVARYVGGGRRNKRTGRPRTSREMLRARAARMRR